MTFDEGKFGIEDKTGGLTYYKPNLKVRLTEHLVELMQEELLTYIQTYYNFDYVYRESGTYRVDMFPIYTDIKYQNLKVDPILIDPFWFAFNFTVEQDALGNDQQILTLQLPLIENWKAQADVTYGLFWIPISDTLWVELNNVTASVKVQLYATNFGKLSPKIKDIFIDFGTSDIFSSSVIHQSLLRQFVTPMRYFLENAISLFGANMFNRQLQSWTNYYLSDQIAQFPIKLPELNRTANFQVNWRMTQDPQISDGQMDLGFWFDIGPDASYCTLPQQNNEFGFVDDKDRFFQFIITQRLVNCFL